MSPRERLPSRQEDEQRLKRQPTQTTSAPTHQATVDAHRLQKLQRQIGNQAVMRMLGRQRPTQRPSSSIQRYVVLNQQSGGGEDQYLTQQNDMGTSLFSSQEQGPQLDNGNPLAPRVRQPRIDTHNNPPLRVSDDGMMAVENVTQDENEVRSFYTTDSILHQSNQRLTDVNSKARLAPDSTNVIKVPTDPSNPRGAGMQRRTLRAVRPTGAGGGAFGAAVNGASECNVVAEQIIGQESNQQGVGIFSGTGGTVAQKQFKFKHEDALTSDLTPGDFSGVVSGGHGDESEMDTLQGMDITVDRTVLRNFQRTHAVKLANGAIGDRVAERYAYRGTPLAARQEIDERIRLDQPVSNILGRSIIRRHQESKPVLDYGRMTPGDRRNRSRDVGVNSFAMPEVGEAYGAFTQSLSGIVPMDNNNREVRGGFDIQNESPGDRDRINQMLDPTHAATANRVGDFLRIAANTLTNIQGGLWTWHYAAVVAKSGTDMVTLENYNRETADRGAKAEALQAMWQALSVTYAHYVDGAITGRPNDQSRIQALQQKLQAEVGALNGGLQRFVQAPDEAGGMANGDRWYFQMYGPANKGGVDQSFHNEWTSAGGFVNPITVRTGAEASPQFREAMVTQLNTFLGLTAHRVNLSNPFRNDLNQAIARIRAQGSKSQASKAYRDAIRDLLPRMQVEVVGAKAQAVARDKHLVNAGVVFNVNNLPQVQLSLNAWIADLGVKRGQTNWPHKKWGYDRATRKLQELLQVAQIVDNAVATELVVIAQAPLEDVH